MFFILLLHLRNSLRTSESETILNRLKYKVYLNIASIVNLVSLRRGKRTLYVNHPIHTDIQTIASIWRENI